MEDRYPYIRFVADAAQVVAGAVAVILFLGGTMNACEYGGFAGFVSFIVTLVVTGVGYIAAMVWVESLRVFLDIEASTRDILTTVRGQQTRESRSSDTGS
jgi:hypothetical protein